MFDPSDILPTKVAIYIRWSTDDQGEGTTLETQLERCKHYLISQGWQFNEQLTYVDDGYSGGNLDRPALSKLREDVRAGIVQCVVVYKIDRLSRSVVDIVELVLREWEGRCYIKSTSEDINTITPAGKMFFYILVSFAEYERSVIKERTMGGKIKRAEHGMNPGFRPPFGYVKGSTPGLLVVVEHEANLVRRIFDMYRNGNGVHQIADGLNREGVRRRGQLWNQLGVRKLLTNPAYIGTLAYGKTTRTTKEQRERHGLGKYIHFEKPRHAFVEKAFLPIIDYQMWSDVQRLLIARSTKHKDSVTKPTYSDYLLSGIAVCQCGAPIYGKAVGKGHYYYYCSARKRQGKSVCNAGHVRVDEVNTEIERRVKALLAAETRFSFLRTIEQDVGQRIAAVQAALGEARSEARSVLERARRVEADYRRGDLPSKLYARELEALETDESTIRDRIHLLERRLAECEAAGAESKVIASTLDMVEGWETLNVPERKQLLDKLTIEVKLYREANTHSPPILEIDWVRLSETPPCDTHHD